MKGRERGVTVSTRGAKAIQLAGGRADLLGLHPSLFIRSDRSGASQKLLNFRDLRPAFPTVTHVQYYVRVDGQAGVDIVSMDGFDVILTLFWEALAVLSRVVSRLCAARARRARSPFSQCRAASLVRLYFGCFSARCKRCVTEHTSTEAGPAQHRGRACRIFKSGLVC